ncbi:MAG: hypothetical protein NW216_14225 [Hyphomicrobium sp.]|nr:hypothetical protein [Hyphomicrobium sp.]
MVMVAMMIAVCGVTWALGTAVMAGDAPSAEPIELAAMTPADISGRWSGTTRAITADPGRCGPDGCKLTMDISKCGDGWCGIEVRDSDACGGQALQLKSAAEPDRKANVFTGKLSLAEGAQDYVVEAYFYERDGAVRTLSFVGDTGPELMMFRRSFPFHANLTASGEAKCKPEKPTS